MRYGVLTRLNCQISYLTEKLKALDILACPKIGIIRLNKTMVSGQNYFNYLHDIKINNYGAIEEVIWFKYVKALQL